MTREQRLKSEAKYREKYADKDKDWLFDKITELRLENDKMRNKVHEMRKKNFTLQYELSRKRNDDHIQSLMDTPIREANENMAKVLKEAGIRPMKLIVTFKDFDCEGCEGSFVDAEGNLLGCEANDRTVDIYHCPTKDVTYTDSYYTMYVDDGELDGITGIFKNDEIADVVSVVMADTGKVLYENKELAELDKEV